MNESYLNRLKRHPGVPIATVMTVMGFFAGIDGGLIRGLIGAGMMGLLWIPVLLTA